MKWKARIREWERGKRKGVDNEAEKAKLEMIKEVEMMSRKGEGKVEYREIVKRKERIIKDGRESVRKRRRRRRR